MSRNDESPVLLVATVFCAWFCLCTLAQQSTLSGANFVKFPLSVLVVPSEILASSGAKSSLDCAFRCLKTAFCISFNFGINSQTCELLATDKFRFSTMFNSSEDSDHYTFMTPCVKRPCQSGQCVPVYGQNAFYCDSSVILYYLAAYGQDCDQFCKTLHLRCVDINAFPTGNALSIFESLGYECKSGGQYKYLGDPYYGVAQLCGGVKNIPNKTDCLQGGNNNIRRLCPCR